MDQTTLNPKEKKVFEQVLHNLRVPKRKTKQQLVIGMVGLVGSGKHEVAQVLARELGAVLLSSDEIRVALRKQKVRYTNVRYMIETLTKEIVSREGNVVIASDHVDAEKRNRLQKIAKDAGIRSYFIRTSLEHDVMLGRILSATYKPTDLFGGATSIWKGKNKGAVVKLREMWRRTPNHYFWNSEEGGHWVQKSMSFIFAEIDTTDIKKWKREVKQVVERLQ
jgi:predicted kinase